jgi:hypothetical protein
MLAKNEDEPKKTEPKKEPPPRPKPIEEPWRVGGEKEKHPKRESESDKKP